MHPESGGGTRCAKHPSRTFTGFCPVCLSERLTRVDKAERVVPKRCSYGLPGDDGGESLSPPGADDGSTGKKKQPPPPPQVKVRKTLALLFQMNDDADKKSDLDAEVIAPVPATSKHLGDFIRDGNDREVGQQSDETRDSAVSCEDGAACVHGDMCGAEHGSSLISECRVGSDTKASSTSCSTTVGNSSSETCRASKTDSMRDDSSMSRGSSSTSSASYWLGSTLARTSAKWGITGVLRRCSSVHERGLRDSPCSKGEKQSETNSSTRRSSCDWNLCSGSRKNSCEDPRHSWDSTVMGRAFMCSFTCLDEKENVNPVEGRNSGVNESNCATSGRENCRVLLDGAVAGNSRTIAGPAAAAVSENIAGVEKKAKVSKGKPLKDMFVEERHHGVIGRSFSKRISNRWSKVWSWSISSPFIDLSTKQGAVLDRSLSESWRERHSGKMESDNGSHMVNSSRAVASSNRSTYFGSGDRQNTMPDWPRSSKRDYRFRRTQSVHYSSPGNLDNGLLRFYLTPLRSTNRNPARGRVKTSRSFTRGIFGLS